jgi:hypothetical protein
MSSATSRIPEPNFTPNMYRQVLPTRTVCTAVDDDAMDKYTTEQSAKFQDNLNDLCCSLSIIASADKRMAAYSAFMVFDSDGSRKDEVESIRSLVEECRKKGKFKEIRDLGLPHVPFPTPSATLNCSFRDPLARTTAPCQKIVLYKP